MANEAVLLKQYSLPTSFVCNDSDAFEKGRILMLATPNKAVSGQDAFNPVLAEKVAGIVAAEKIANNGVTKVSCYIDGEFKVYVSGGAVAGQPVISSLSGGTYVNYVQSGANLGLLSGSQVMGIFLESCTASDNTARIKLRLR